ncbi:hypothetical protein L6452_27280 [Arctium lappa]|uniref:Uncharacterized protein n=1 Tax=Arctium lappa TaxID=4217 RepID=A0ACB8ZW44_ARCLA|nr:hypothetical protein L6452_27280 [Arctium lappa]
MCESDDDDGGGGDIKVHGLTDSIAIMTKWYKKYTRGGEFKPRGSSNPFVKKPEMIKPFVDASKRKAKAICYNCENHGYFASECRSKAVKNRPVEKELVAYYKAKYLEAIGKGKKARGFIAEKTD